MNELSEHDKKALIRLSVMIGLAMIGAKVKPVAKKSKFKKISHAKYYKEKFKNLFKF